MRSWPSSPPGETPDHHKKEALSTTRGPKTEAAPRTPSPLRGSQGWLQGTHCGMTLASWTGREVPGEVTLEEAILPQESSGSE